MATFNLRSLMDISVRKAKKKAKKKDQKKPKITSTELLVCGWIKKEIPDSQTIPMTIQYLIKTWSAKVFEDSRIVSFMLDLKLSTLIQNHLKNKMNYQLLFRGSDNEYSSKAFHAACDSPNVNCKTIVIAQSDWGNIFGGYTSKSWLNKSGFYHKDPSAFLYLLEDRDKEENKKCPLIFTIKPEHTQNAICCLPEYGPAFGDGPDLVLRDKESHRSESKLKSYSNPEYNKWNLCGGNNLREKDQYVFECVDYEVCKVIDQ